MPKTTTPLFLVYSGSDLERVVYRAVSGCPPTLDDFRSYVELKRRYPIRNHFRATGISVSRDRATLLAQMRKYELGHGVAMLELRGSEAVWASSGGRAHLTIWAPATVLLSRVIQCDDHE